MNESEKLKDVISKTRSGDLRYMVYTIDRFLVSKKREFWIKKIYDEGWVLGEDIMKVMMDE